MFRKDNNDEDEQIETVVGEVVTDTYSTNQNASSPFSNATLNINVNTNSKNNDDEDSGDSKKKKEKNIAKNISILLSFLLCGTLVGFALYSLISLPIKETTKIKETYLNIKDYSYTQTVRALEEFDKKNSNKIKDFSVVGSKLFIGECKLTPDVFLNPSSVYGENNIGVSLYEIKTDVFNSVNAKTNIIDNKYFIDFSLVDQGSYLIYPFAEESNPNNSKKNIAPYSIKSDKQIDISFYTLPNSSTGTRKKVNIRNNNLSPFTLIDVIDVGTSLPAGYYDAVLFPSIYAENDGIKENAIDTEVSLDLKKAVESLVNALNSIKTNNEKTNVYKIAYAESLIQANSTIANTAIAISDKINDNYTSVYLNADTYKDFKIKVLEDSTTLPKYDFYPEIRELIGYLDNSGAAFGGIPYNDLVNKSDSILGKESIIVSKKEGINDDTYGTIIDALRR